MSGYGSTGGEGQQGLNQGQNDLAQKASDVMDQAREQTGQAMDQVRGNAFQMMDQQKSRAADSLGSVAHALHQTGDNLNGSDQGALGQYAHRAGDTVDQLSQQLRNKSVDQLLSEAEDFARREPEVFLGGAVLLGLLAARFFKASSRRPQMDRGYGQQNYGQGRFGSEGYNQGAWSGEGIDYRSAGTGGYRTTVSGSTSEHIYGSAAGGTMTSRDISMGRERETSYREGQQGQGESHLEDASWAADDEDIENTDAGSSQA